MPGDCKFHWLKCVITEKYGTRFLPPVRRRQKISMIFPLSFNSKAVSGKSSKWGKGIPKNIEYES